MNDEESDEFEPARWQIDMLNVLRQQVIHTSFDFNPDPNNRPKLRIDTPHSKGWLRRRTRFAKKWLRMVDIGLDVGYLEDQIDGPLTITEDSFTSEWVHNPEYIETHKTVKIPYAKPTEPKP